MAKENKGPQSSQSQDETRREAKRRRKPGNGGFRTGNLFEDILKDRIASLQESAEAWLVKLTGEQSTSDEINLINVYCTDWQDNCTTEAEQLLTEEQVAQVRLAVVLARLEHKGVSIPAYKLEWYPEVLKQAYETRKEIFEKEKAAARDAEAKRRLAALAAMKADELETLCRPICDRAIELAEAWAGETVVKDKRTGRTGPRYQKEVVADACELVELSIFGGNSERVSELETTLPKTSVCHMHLFIAVAVLDCKVRESTLAVTYADWYNEELKREAWRFIKAEQVQCDRAKNTNELAAVS